MALNSSAEQPQPLGRVIGAVKDWVGRLGEVWVDAQVVEIKRRNAPTQFMTFRDRVANMSAQLPRDRRFAAALLILREWMHHLDAGSVALVDQ